MKTIIRNNNVIKERDMLFDFSGVHSPYFGERAKWVLDNVSKGWFDEYRVIPNSSDALVVPPFAVVISTPIADVLDYNAGRRYIQGIELCESIDDIKESIQHYLLESAVRYNVQVDLFIHNGRCFEKKDYDIGTYEAGTGAVGYHCTFDELDTYFATECALNKQIYEDDIICAKIELHPEDKIYVEIPNLWEVSYTIPATGEQVCKYYSYKDLKTVINDMMYTMLSDKLESFTIESSWHTLTLSVSEGTIRALKKTDDIFDEVHRIRDALNIDIQLNY